MKTKLKQLALILATAALAFAQCGLVPLKPLVPLGCKDLKPQCTCDAHGQHCGYSWVCVK